LLGEGLQKLSLSIVTLHFLLWWSYQLHMSSVG